MNPSFPHLDALARQFGRSHRLFRDSVARARGQFGDAWAAQVDDLVGRLFPDGDGLANAVEGYAAFAMDSLRRQERFNRDGRYPAKSFAEASAEVYQNEAFMTREYLPGLLLSHYLWGHHYRQLVFCRAAFVEAMALSTSPFAEIGVGTGIYSRSILEAIPAATGIGYDISPYSKAFAEAHLDRFDVLQRFEVELRDFLVAPPGGQVRWLVCVEVLEHLEDPTALLRGLRAMLAADGKAFITAALNAANADHIYLYRNAEEVATHLRAAGFAIEQYFVGNAYPAIAPGQQVPAVAAFVATAAAIP